MASPKERILETASKLFHQQGYNSTGINQIIQEAAVAKASFYQHFKSKDQLCIAYLQGRHDFWFAELRSACSQAKKNKKKIAAAFDFLIHMNEKENFRGCSFLNILSEIGPDQEAILQCIQDHKNDLRQFFESEIEDRSRASHIYLLFEAALVESQLFKSNNLIEKAKKISINLL